MILLVLVSLTVNIDDRASVLPSGSMQSVRDHPIKLFITS